MQYMKQAIIFMMLILVLTLSIPIFATNGFLQNLESTGISQANGVFARVTRNEPDKPSSVPEAPPSAVRTACPEGHFRVLDKSTNQIMDIPYDELIRGAVAAEMPPTFEEEALKAQAVASFTYFCYMRDQQTKKPTPELAGADFSIDSRNASYYITEAQTQIKYGNNFDFYNTKIRSVVESVRGQVIQHDGKCILAMYHAISSGVTETCAHVLGNPVSYLVSVPSPGDLLVPGYKTTVEIPCKEFRAKISQASPNINLASDHKNWSFAQERTDSGSVKKMLVGSATVDGKEIRQMFGLRSANFDAAVHGDKIVFTVRGYGHGIGMSQHGANSLAKQNHDYKFILDWYYPGCNLGTI